MFAVAYYEYNYNLWLTLFCDLLSKKNEQMGVGLYLALRVKLYVQHVDTMQLLMYVFVGLFFCQITVQNGIKMTSTPDARPDELFLIQEFYCIGLNLPLHLVHLTLN